MKNSVLCLFLACSAHAQQWVRTDTTDQLRGTKIIQYTLDGKFLTPPKNATAETRPMMVAQCTPGDFNHHTAHGKLIKAFIYVGAVLNSQVGYDASSRVPVEFRLDDGKIQKDSWSHSTDFSALFFNPYFPEGGFANMLYGHQLPHKPNTSPAIKKVVLEVPEYLGGAIVMQFDMPTDPTEVADNCGEIVHKRGE
jgi:hypothetical protein